MSDVPKEFGDYYGLYARWLRLRLTRLYGQDAEDLIQDTWLRFMPYQARNEVRAPRALLMTIATRLVADLGRDRSRRRRCDGAGSQAVAQVEWPAQTEELLAKELVLGLPEALRDVFVLSRFGGLTNNQIAERLGISPKTVEWRMTKALAHCAAQFRR